jgi:hypothetical protein
MQLKKEQKLLASQERGLHFCEVQSLLLHPS